MLIAVLDEGVDIGEAHLVRARGNAGDRLEHRRRLVEDHVQALGLEVAPVLGKQKCRSQPVERELDAGLRRCRPRSRQRDRRREEKDGPNDPRQVEEAHGSSLYFGPRATPPCTAARRPDKEHERAKRKARSRFEPALHKFQTPRVPFCARMGVILQACAYERLLRLTTRAEPESVRCEPVMIPDTTTALAADAASPPLFKAPYAPPDEAMAAELLREAARARDAERRIDAYARRLIEGIRARTGGLGGIEDFLHAYSLSTQEGLALMVLAEALLRVPDAATADRLIEDKLATGDWSSHHVKSSALLVSASAWTLGVTARIIHPGETPDSILESLIKRLGIPAVRAATRQAMRLLGSHFVLGQTIEEALQRARMQPTLRYSFDMLGEGARTAADAERYFASYAHAIDAIAAGAGDIADRPGISVKFSALHPRFEAVSRHRVLTELVPRALELARKARDLDLDFTVDAEEADRLELTLDVVAAMLADASLRGWEGFGLAVQAYQKRAPAVIDWLNETASRLRRRLTVRLVKGAYWDTEIKRAQERGLADYPVFTRKAMTDLCYAACTRKLLAARPRLYPQFATHNALTVASVIEDAGGVEGYEFQRLHGMGEVLYQLLLADHPEAACRIYAPVGGHRDLLAYLVRRLLENGANSSFVSVAADPAVPIASILERPQERIGDVHHARNPKIPLPRDLYGPDRRNSSGVEFGDRAALAALLAEIRAGELSAEAWPLIDGTKRPGSERRVLSPIDAKAIGRVGEGNDALAAAAVAAAQAGFLPWAAAALDMRAGVLERAGDLLEARRGWLIALLQAEGGKTLDDAMAEVREAVDFCRYYALEARRTLAPLAFRAPPAKQTSFAIAAAACSPASAHGIFRSRSFSVRSAPRSLPAIRWWRNPPSRRR